MVLDHKSRSKKKKKRFHLNQRSEILGVCGFALAIRPTKCSSTLREITKILQFRPNLVV